MNGPQDPLWRALADMRITPDDVSLGFTAKLAREQGWSVAHAEAVVEEYRRFLYLGATGEGPVTPSEDVDQAWHLHLTYSRHYWEVLCGGILGRPFHHEPASGSASEDMRHRTQYRATLGRYRATFGIAPPPAIWPVLPEHVAPQAVRIDRSRYWLVPKAATGRTGGVLAASLLIAACGALAGNGGGASAMAIPVVAIAIGAVVIALVVVSARNSHNRKGGSNCGSGSSCGSDSSDSDGGGSCGGGGCGGD